jgi:hypothetical protein
MCLAYVLLIMRGCIFPTTRLSVLIRGTDNFRMSVIRAQSPRYSERPHRLRIGKMKT